MKNKEKNLKKWLTNGVGIGYNNVCAHEEVHVNNGGCSVVG